MEGIREPFEARKGVVSGVESEARDASAIQSLTHSIETDTVIVRSGCEQTKNKKGGGRGEGELDIRGGPRIMQRCDR